MERLIDKLKNKLDKDVETNRLVDLTNINKIKNVEINYDPETNKKLFIYKDSGIEIKNDVIFRIKFFKINPQDNNDIEKVFEIIHNEVGNYFINMDNFHKRNKDKIDIFDIQFKDMSSMMFSIDKSQYKELLGNCMKDMIELEEYELCSEIHKILEGKKRGRKPKTEVL